MNKVSAIILAAGSGSRFGEQKQFKKLNGRSIWTYSLDAFNKSNCFEEFILVVSKESLNELNDSEEFYNFCKTINIKLVCGGESRHDSVYNGLQSVDENNNIICIHDAARPFVKQKYIRDVIGACLDFDGSILAIPSTDTVKKIRDGIVEKTIDRESVWMAQTPQAFQKDKLLHAIELDSNLKITDESTLMELAGYKIKIITGDSTNLKITRKIDWELAKIIESEK